MANKSWLPLKDQELRAFCNSFRTTIQPNASLYGLGAGDSTALNAQWNSYNAALSVADEPSTRTRVTVASKQIEKDKLIELMRDLYKKVLAANLTDDKMEALGLPVRDTSPTPIPPPSIKPGIAVKSRSENTVTIGIFDPADPNRRGRPEGVDGIAIFTHLGEEAPSTESAWTFRTNTTRMTADIEFPANVEPGTKVWFTCFFFNPRAQSGPAATPVSTHLPGGAAMAA